MTPAPSAPSTRGGSMRWAPETIQRSRWFRPAKRMSTATMPSAGSVRGRSSTFTPEGPEGSRNTAQRPSLSTLTVAIVAAPLGPPTFTGACA